MGLPPPGRSPRSTLLRPGAGPEWRADAPDPPARPGGSTIASRARRSNARDRASPRRGADAGSLASRPTSVVLTLDVELLAVGADHDLDRDALGILAFEDEDDRAAV